MLCNFLHVFLDFSFLLAAAFSATHCTEAYLFLLWKAAERSTPASPSFAVILCNPLTILPLPEVKKRSTRKVLGRPRCKSNVFEISLISYLLPFLFFYVFFLFLDHLE